VTPNNTRLSQTLNTATGSRRHYRPFAGQAGAHCTCRLWSRYAATWRL